MLQHRPRRDTVPRHGGDPPPRPRIAQRAKRGGGGRQSRDAAVGVPPDPPVGHHRWRNNRWAAAHGLRYPRPGTWPRLRAATKDRARGERKSALGGITLDLGLNNPNPGFSPKTQLSENATTSSRPRQSVRLEASWPTWLTCFQTPTYPGRQAHPLPPTQPTCPQYGKTNAHEKYVKHHSMTNLNNMFMF